MKSSNLQKDAHPLVRFVRAGRGYGVTLCPVLDYVGTAKGAVLHIVDDRPGFPGVLCGRKVAADITHTDFDARTVAIKNRPVCGQCRTAIGHVPPPAPLSEPKGDT